MRQADDVRPQTAAEAGQLLAAGQPRLQAVLQTDLQPPAARRPAQLRQAQREDQPVEALGAAEADEELLQATEGGGQLRLPVQAHVDQLEVAESGQAVQCLVEGLPVGGELLQVAAEHSKGGQLAGPVALVIIVVSSTPRQQHPQQVAVLGPVHRASRLLVVGAGEKGQLGDAGKGGLQLADSGRRQLAAAELQVAHRRLLVLMRKEEGRVAVILSLLCAEARCKRSEARLAGEDVTVEVLGEARLNGREAVHDDGQRSADLHVHLSRAVVPGGTDLVSTKSVLQGHLTNQSQKTDIREVVTAQLREGSHSRWKEGRGRRII